VTVQRHADLDPGRAIEVVAAGEVELLGRMPWSSNATFLCEVRLGDDACQAIYKPHRGERPLWDFPDGLYQREAAAWVVSEALGWRLVPETVVRPDAPIGVGSLQRFIWGDQDETYFSILEDERHHDQLRQLAAFDVVTNNTDRKGGHCLLGDDDRVWAIDNGLCFHVDPKLRTVIWDFSGERLPDPWRVDLARVGDAPPEALSRLLSEREVQVFARRCKVLAERGVLPDPDPDRRPYPWPLV
jgi:uncharacterized repeat protein (TIGR03843 family)